MHPETTPTDAVSVVGNWELVSFNLNDGITIPVDDPSAFTATFTAESQLNAKADCNQCNTSPITSAIGWKNSLN